jgi:hypothetical protein
MTPIGRVISNAWHDGLFDRAITEVIGESYDPRNLKLYRVEGKGLFWLPDFVVEVKDE